LEGKSLPLAPIQCCQWHQNSQGAEKNSQGELMFHYFQQKGAITMKKKKFFTPYCLVICMLFATMVGCSSKHEKSVDVIEKSSSTTTTTERPVMQNKRQTTTTTTEMQQ
jgi:hypothetical protein